MKNSIFTILVSAIIYVLLFIYISFEFYNKGYDKGYDDSNIEWQSHIADSIIIYNKPDVVKLKGIEYYFWYKNKKLSLVRKDLIKILYYKK